MSENDSITEAAKAVQEASKLGAKVVDTGRSFGGWLDKVFGQAITELVALHWTDRIQARRVESAIFDWERLTLLLQKAQARVGAVAIPVPVPPKIAIPLLEHATMEFEEDLHTLWANLLASAMTSEDQVSKQFVAILADLSTSDAVALADFYRLGTTGNQEPWTDGNVTYGPGFNGLDYGDMTGRNLARLGLIEPSPVGFKTYDPPSQNRYGDFAARQYDVELPGDLQICRMTPTGVAFCKAVAIDTVQAEGG